MLWFKHDSDASSDAKIRKLIIRHGAVGYAIYFHCLELIAGNVSNSNVTFELEHDSEIIADNLRILGDSKQSGMDVVHEIMLTILDLDLFKSVDGRISCPKMIKRLDSSMTSNPAFRMLIQEAKTTNNILENHHDHIMTSHDTIMTPSCKNRIEKNTREYKRREENIRECNTVASDEPPVTQKRFSKPTLEQVTEYCKERANGIQPQLFIDFYESKGWKVGKTPMKDWKACVRTWENKDRSSKKKTNESYDLDMGGYNKL